MNPMICLTAEDANAWIDTLASLLANPRRLKSSGVRVHARKLLLRVAKTRDAYHAARDAAAGLSLAPRKPQPKLGSKIPANSPKDPYASGVFSGTVDEVATLRTLWKILNAAVTPEAHPWTTGDRRTMWQTMRGGVGAGGAMHRATKEKEEKGADTETSLEDLMYRYGTDKGKDDHKYSDFYAALFDPLRRRGLNVT